jgi:hypothetical protein
VKTAATKRFLQMPIPLLSNMDLNTSDTSEQHSSNIKATCTQLLDSQATAAEA